MRLYETFPIKVRGRDASNRPFEIETLLNNLSSSGLYMLMGRRVKPGDRLFMLIRIANERIGNPIAPRIAVLGEVCRVEQKTSDSWGVAVQFTKHRFL